MRSRGLWALLMALTGVRNTMFECSEEFRREARLYPQCIPTSCGRGSTDISQDQPSDNIGHTLYLKIDKNILQNITTAGYHIEIN